MNGELVKYVRPLVTVMFAGGFIYLAIEGTVSADAFIATATAVIMYWFKARSDEKEKGE